MIFTADVVGGLCLPSNVRAGIRKQRSISIVKARGGRGQVEKWKEGNNFQEGILAFSSST